MLQHIHQGHTTVTRRKEWAAARVQDTDEDIMIRIFKCLPAAGGNHREHAHASMITVIARSM